MNFISQDGERYILRNYTFTFTLSRCIIYEWWMLGAKMIISQRKWLHFQDKGTLEDATCPRRKQRQPPPLSVMRMPTWISNVESVFCGTLPSMTFVTAGGPVPAVVSAFLGPFHPLPPPLSSHYPPPVLTSGTLSLPPWLETQDCENSRKRG